MTFLILLIAVGWHGNYPSFSGPVHWWCLLHKLQRERGSRWRPTNTSQVSRRRAWQIKENSCCQGEKKGWGNTEENANRWQQSLHSRRTILSWRDTHVWWKLRFTDEAQRDSSERKTSQSKGVFIDYQFRTQPCVKTVCWSEWMSIGHVAYL